MKLKHIGKKQGGFAMPTVLAFIIIAGILSGVVLEVIFTNLTIVSRNIQSQQAFNIAEAGVNYYLWHLSHNPNDFQDGTGGPSTPDASLGYGPYTHNYVDDNAINQGTFTLWVKPAGSGSTIVTIRSIGKIKNSDVVRTVEARIGATSFASYGVVSDSALWFGNTESANGAVHSNQGVRMDGASNADVTSANATYVPSNQLGGDGQSHPGVWCKSSVTSPVDCNSRPKSDWHYPVTSVDFNQVTGSLCTIKKTAFASDSATASYADQSNACSLAPSTRTAAYLPQRSPAASYNPSRGYLISLNQNGTYDLSYVNNEVDYRTPYTSALTLQSIATGITIPTSGVIYAEDNLWVRSATNFDGRLTIGAGRLNKTSRDANITIVGNLLYHAKDGSDAIGLVAENSVYIAPYAPPASGSFNYEIDAAIIAITGSVEYPGVYNSRSWACTRGWVNSNQTFTFYGSVATRQTWTWTWLQGNSACGDAAYDATNGYVSGIEHNATQYDTNLLYAPPPHFPITGGYMILNWREVLTRP